MNKILMSIIYSRYSWFLQGMPDLARSNALFHARRNTMTSAIRCRTLWTLCRNLIKSGIPGDFVECGVWKGGSAGVMGLTLKKFDRSETRKLHLFDSFEGLPQPTIKDGISAARYSGGVNSGELVSVHKCEASIESVHEFLIDKIRLNQKTIIFHKGWFQDTIPNLGSDVEKIAVLRLDGDWYESTKVCLEHLYDRVSHRGVIILDDYFCWEGCRKATDEFRVARGLKEPIIRIDSDSGYWIKNH